MNKTFTLLVALAVIAGGSFYAFGPFPPFWIQSEIKSSMTRWVPDPESLQLINLRYSEDDSGMVCGEMNAKNRMGAYTGFKKFAFSRERKFTFVKGLDPSADSMIRLFKCE